MQYLLIGSAIVDMLSKRIKSSVEDSREHFQKGETGKGIYKIARDLAVPKWEQDLISKGTSLVSKDKIRDQISDKYLDMKKNNPELLKIVPPSVPHNITMDKIGDELSNQGLMTPDIKKDLTTLDNQDFVIPHSDDHNSYGTQYDDLISKSGVTPDIQASATEGLGSLSEFSKMFGVPEIDPFGSMKG